MHDWLDGQLADSIAALDAGVSVNAEDRPHGAGEIGVLKTSAVSGGRFLSDQNKTVVERERRLVAESVQGDSILVSRMNTPELVGESCYVREPHPSLFLPDRLWQLKPKDRAKISMRWLSFVLQSAAYRRHVAVHATGTSGTMKNLPKAKLLGLPVRYPAPPEQSKIADVLDILDTAIHETQAIIAKLEAIERGLLHDLLTRGIDVNGELRPPQAEAPRLYKPSPLGWIPKEWEEVTLGDIARRSGGFLQTGPFGSQLHAHEYAIEGVPVVMPQDMVGGGLSAENIARVAERRASALAKHRLRPNDIVFSRRGDLSRCVAIGDQHAGWLCGTGCLQARLPNVEVNGYWLALIYRQPVTQAQVMGRAVGSTMANLNTSILAAISIGRPSVGEQEEIFRRMETASARIRSEEQAVNKLRLAKAGLADDLLTGRVRVTPLLTAARK